MLRKMVLALILLPGFGVPQTLAKSQEKRTRALDVAATTPFFTKRGADAVKRVVQGADQHKEDEKVTDPQEGTSGAPGPTTGQPSSPQKTAPGQAQPASPQPQPEPTFSWRLVGISYGSRRGVALFEESGKSLSVQAGAALDPETRVLAVSHRAVTLLFHGKRLELTPW